MARGWNEIKERAVKFSKEREDTVNGNVYSWPFIKEPDEKKRIEFLFVLYDRYTAGMFGMEKKKK